MTHSLSCRLLSSFLILELVLQTVLPSLRPEVLEARADDRGHSHGALVVNLSERLEAFEHLCVKDGEVFKGTVVDHDEQGGVYRLDCQAMARTLLSELDYARVQGASPNGCVVPPSGIDDFGRYLKEFEKLQNKIACQNPQGLEACVADVACNLFRSAPVVGQLSGLITGIFVKGNDAGSRAVQGCFGNQNSSCITEFIVGMVKDLLSNVTAIFDLAGMVWDKTKEIAVAAWKKFLGLIHGPGGVENKTTTAGLVASGQSDESIRQAKSDQQNWLRSLVSRLYDSIIDSILTDYACQKWSGPPHGLNSKCLEPVTRETWACASCNAKLNAVCGVLGVVGGEVLLAFFTGAAGNAAKAGVKVTQAAIMTTKVGRSLSEGAKIAKESKIYLKGMEALHGAIALSRPVAESAAKLAEVSKGFLKGVSAGIQAHPATKAILKWASKQWENPNNIPFSLARETTEKLGLPLVNGVKIVAKGSAWTVKKYFGLMEHAYELGAGVGDRIASQAFKRMTEKNASRMGELATKAAGNGEELFRDYRKIEAGKLPNVTPEEAEKAARLATESAQEARKVHQDYLDTLMQQVKATHPELANNPARALEVASGDLRKEVEAARAKIERFNQIAEETRHKMLIYQEKQIQAGIEKANKEFQKKAQASHQTNVNPNSTQRDRVKGLKIAAQDAEDIVHRYKNALANATQQGNTEKIKEALQKNIDGYTAKAKEYRAQARQTAGIDPFHFSAKQAEKKMIQASAAAEGDLKKIDAYLAESARDPANLDVTSYMASRKNIDNALSAEAQRKFRQAQALLDQVRNDSKMTGFEALKKAGKNDEYFRLIQEGKDAVEKRTKLENLFADHSNAIRNEVTPLIEGATQVRVAATRDYVDAIQLKARLNSFEPGKGVHHSPSSEELNLGHDVMAKVVEGQNKINTAINYLDQQLEKMSSTNQYRAMLESQRKTLYDQWHEMNKLYTEVNTKYLIPSAERAARVSSVEAGRTLNVEAAEQKLATAKKGASEILPEGKDLKEVSSAKQAEYLEAQQLIADAAKETEKAAQAKLKTLSKGRTPATTQPDVAAASERAQTAAAEAQQAQATIQKAKKAWVESGQALAEKRLKDVEEARKAEDALIPIEYYDIAPAFLSSQENRVLKNQVLDALEARRAAAVGARTEAENARRYLKELGGTSNPGAASRLQDQIDRANKALDDINIDRRLYGFPPLSTQ